MTERRSKGDGSLSERSPGVWRLRVFLGTNPTTGKPRQAARTYRGGKTGAIKALQKFQREVDDGKVALADPTMGFLLDRWMEQRARVGARPTTLYNSRKTIDKHIRPHLGQIRLAKLRAWDLDQYYEAMRDLGLGDGTIRAHHILISGALTQAVKWGMVTKNVATQASPPKQPKTRRHAPTGEEIRRLVALAKEDGDEDLATLVMLAALTGARRGELCGLQWPDVDWERQMITFRRQRVPVEGGDVTGPLKAGDDRPVSIGELGVYLLRFYRSTVEERARQLGIGVPADGWLLSYECGRVPMDAKNVSYRVTSLGKRAGVNVTLHELRHYAATQMVGGGVDVRTAAARLGHAPEVLLSTYAHALSDRDRAAAELLEADLRGPVSVESRAIGG